MLDPGSGVTELRFGATCPPRVQQSTVTRIGEENSVLYSRWQQLGKMADSRLKTPPSRASFF